MTTKDALIYGGAAVGLVLAWRWWQGRAKPAANMTQGAAMTADGSANTTYGTTGATNGLYATAFPGAGGGRVPAVGGQTIQERTVGAVRNANTPPPPAPAPNTRMTTQTNGLVVQGSWRGAPR